MGFKSNQSEAFQNGLKPEGDYECIITAIEEHTTKKGSVGLNFAQLPDGKEYDSLQAYCTDLLNKCIRVDLTHEEWNGKEQERINFVNPTKYPECKHKFKSSAPKADSFATKQTGFATPKTNTQADSAIGSLEDFEDVLTDDGVPF